MYTKLIGFVYLVNVLFLSAALNWVKDLYRTDCGCGQDWRLKYMSSYLALGILFNVFGFVALVMRRSWKFVFEKYLVPVMGVLTVGYVSMALSYFVDLQKKDCDCAKNQQEKFMYFIAFLQVIIVGGSVLLRVLDKSGTAGLRL
jgi:hypothetical protein